MSKFKVPLSAIIGVVAIIGVTCGITGCNSGGGLSSDTSPIVDVPEVPTNGNGLPPDPGTAGKATLEGIDSNGNKVRDDMEIAIYERHPDDELKRDALMRSAIVFQEAVLAGGAVLDGDMNSDELFNTSKRIGLASACLVDRFGFDAIEEGGFLEYLLTNTNERGRAYDTYLAAGSKSSLVPDPDTACQKINL